MAAVSVKRSIVSLWALPLKGINWQPYATHPLFIGVNLYCMLYCIIFQFLITLEAVSCSFSPTHLPCFCSSSRQGRWQRGLFLLILPDLYFVSSDVEINFSLGQKQTVLLMCWWRGQFIFIVMFYSLLVVSKKRNLLFGIRTRFLSLDTH